MAREKAKKTDDPKCPDNKYGQCMRTVDHKSHCRLVKPCDVKAEYCKVK